MERIVSQILKEDQIRSVETLSGGDINDVVKVTTNNRIWCVKLNDSQKFPGMFEAETRGLNTLRSSRTFRVPEVYQTGRIDGYSFVAMEFIPNGGEGADPELFGSLLAGLHRCTNESFGLDSDNYIGSLPQRNSQRSEWPEFYAELRILPLVSRLYDTGDLGRSDCRAFESFCKEIHSIFPSEKPALLHGDLWNGNYLTDDAGSPCLIDPAIYYGHREMDIGMMKLFGGFNTRIFEHYNHHMPLEKGWEKRVDYTQLYPLLVHAILFRGGYVMQVKRIIDTFRS